MQALKFESTSTATVKATSSSTLRASKYASTSKLSATAVATSALSLENFLIERSVENYVLGNNFYWYLVVECDSKEFGSVYKKILAKFMNRISETQMEGEPNRIDLLNRQSEFIKKIAKLALDLRLSKESRLKKIERLHSILKDSKHGLGNFKAIPLPLDASISIVGISVEESSIFKSNLFPLKLSLMTTENESYSIIFKSGDDLRQDQLVIQLFTLMNNLLKKENLDLKLVNYKVLATGNLQGAVQFIQAKTLQNIIADHGNLLNYLKIEGGGGTGETYGVDKIVFDTFVRSCGESKIFA